MKRIKELWGKLPWYVKNAYSVLIVSFIIWMLFVDRNSLISQFSINNKLSELEAQQSYYAEELEKVEALKKELFSTDANKEKFAREHYFMKKENEDIFIIVEKED